jgi:hypothetical protein
MVSVISSERFPRFYHEILRSVTASYQTTFLATETSAQADHNWAALEIQAAKVCVSGAIIQRIFMLTSERQLASHQAMMKLQRDAGIGVRYVLDDAAPEDAAIGTPDFSVINGSALMRTYLSASGISHSSVTADSELIVTAESFFSRLWEESHEVGV